MVRMDGVPEIWKTRKTDLVRRICIRVEREYRKSKSEFLMIEFFWKGLIG